MERPTSPQPCNPCCVERRARTVARANRSATEHSARGTSSLARVCLTGVYDASATRQDRARRIGRARGTCGVSRVTVTRCDETAGFMRARNCAAGHCEGQPHVTDRSRGPIHSPNKKNSSAAALGRNRRLVSRVAVVTCSRAARLSRLIFGHARRNHSSTPMSFVQ